MIIIGQVYYTKPKQSTVGRTDTTPNSKLPLIPKIRFDTHRCHSIENPKAGAQIGQSLNACSPYYHRAYHSYLKIIQLEKNTFLERLTKSSSSSNPIAFRFDILNIYFIKHAPYL